jgi:hypothetical protein
LGKQGRKRVERRRAGGACETRPVKLRTLAALAALAVAGLGLTGCDSKAGTAAVVNGNRITETQLSDYLAPNAQPINVSDGAGGSFGVPARVFVLQYLIRDQVFPLLLSNAGSSVTADQLSADRADAIATLAGDEATLQKQVAQAGLKPRFEAVMVRQQELTDLVGKKLTTQQQLTDAIAKIKDAVSVNPRFGSWDKASLRIVDLSKKQLPAMLSFDGSLPGDVKAPAGQ